MSLPVLVAMVAIGIALIIAAVHFTGGSRRAVIASEEEAMRRFLVDFPAEKVESVRLTLDGAAAHISLYGTGLGIVWVVGSKFLTRLLAPADVKSVALAQNTVSVRFRDFTWAGGDFTFASSSAAGEFAKALDPSLNPAASRS